MAVCLRHPISVPALEHFPRRHPRVAQLSERRAEGEAEKMGGEQKVGKGRQGGRTASDSMARACHRAAAGKSALRAPVRPECPSTGPGSKRLGRTEKEREWRRFHALQAPGNSHCAPTSGNFRTVEGSLARALARPSTPVGRPQRARMKEPDTGLQQPNPVAPPV